MGLMMAVLSVEWKVVRMDERMVDWKVEKLAVWKVVMMADQMVDMMDKKRGLMMVAMMAVLSVEWKAAMLEEMLVEVATMLVEVLLDWKPFL
jgi:hypothetical protein